MTYSEQPLRNAVLSIAAHRQISGPTLQSIWSAGFGEICITYGISDTALARNFQLNEFAQKLDMSTPDLIEGEPLVFFMLDDDITFSKFQAEMLVSIAWNNKRATSGLVMTGEQGKEQPAAMVYDKEKNLFLTGLGALAIPTPIVKNYLLNCDMMTHPASELPLYCATWSGPDLDQPPANRMWLSEDYRLCKRLGGVHLAASLAFGHVKERIITGDAQEYAAEETERDQL